MESGQALLGKRGKAELKKKLQESSREQLTVVLRQSFRYLSLPELQPVVFEVLRLVKTIPKEMLKSLGKSDEHLNRCPLEVKRQVWQVLPALFRAEVEPRLRSCAEALGKISKSETMQYYEGFSPRNRRDSVMLKELLRLFESSTSLYDIVLQVTRSLFIETGDLAYCSLRIDLLMGLVDAGVTQIVRADPIRKFVACLVTCVADGQVDDLQAENLRRSLDLKTISPLIGDIGMVILDPMVQYTLSKACYTATKACIAKKVLPATSKHLHCLTRVCGVVTPGSVRRMLETQQFRQLVLPTEELLPWFYPIVAGAIVEDQIALEQGRKSDGHTRLIMPDQLPGLLKTVPAMRVVLMHYAVERMAAADLKSLLWVLRLLVDPETGLWRYGEDGVEGGMSSESSAGFLPDSIDEQFTRSVVAQLTGTLRGSFVGDCSTALLLIDAFFRPRAGRSAAAHGQLARLAALLRQNAIDTDVARVDAVLLEMCAAGIEPVNDFEFARLRPHYTAAIHHVALESAAHTALKERLASWPAGIE